MLINLNDNIIIMKSDAPLIEGRCNLKRVIGALKMASRNKNRESKRIFNADVTVDK